MAFSSRKTEKGYRDFLKDLKDGSIRPFVMMFGKEQFLVDWAVRALKDHYVNKATEVMDYQSLDPDTDIDTLISSISTVSMLSERRVVVARDFLPLSSSKPKGYVAEDIDRLCSCISEEQEGTLAVLTAEETDGRSKLVKTIRKFGSVYEFDTLNEDDLTAFAAKRFHAEGLKIGRREMSFLIRETGYNNRESEYTLYNFDNDIKKIIASNDRGYVTEEDIAAAVIGDNDTFIFDLLDGISGNDKKRAFEILDNRLSKDQYEAMSVTGAICSQLEIMLEVREMNGRLGMSPAEINRKTGLNEFRVRKALGYAKRYSEQKLRSMLEGIYNVNRNIVTGLMEPRLALEMFIASI